MTRRIYEIPKTANTGSFKRYDRRQAKRDIHDAGVVSHKLSAALRRIRKRRASS